MVNDLIPKKELAAEEGLPPGESALSEKAQLNTGELAQQILKKIISVQPKSTQVKTVDLTQSQGILLRKIYSVKESGAELKMSDLSVIFGSTKSAISQSVSKLERMGLVKRKWSKADRRRILVGLTAKGAAIVEAFNSEYLEFIQSKLDKMEEDEISFLIKILEKCLD